MTVSPDELSNIEKTLCEPGIGSGVIAVLKRRYPHLSWTVCDASDLVEEPFQTCGSFDVHLVDSRDHCVLITQDPENATGIILAKRGQAS